MHKEITFQPVTFVGMNLKWFQRKWTKGGGYLRNRIRPANEKHMKKMLATGGYMCLA